MRLRSWQDSEISHQYPNIWKKGNWVDNAFFPSFDWKEVEIRKKKGVTEWVNKDADMLMEVKFMVSHWIGDDLKLKGISLAQGNRAYFPTGEGGKVGEGRERERENRLQI